MRLLLLLALAACGRRDSEPAPPPPTDPGPVVTTDGVDAWPPTGPGCTELVRCCDATSSDAQLFCRMSAASESSCDRVLASVRTYLGERGAAMPAACTPADQPWVEIAWPDADGWQKAAPEDHGPEQGVLVEYSLGQEVVATVYIYRGGVADIRREQAILSSEVTRALDGMRRAIEAGRYQAVRAVAPVAMARLGSSATAPPAATQQVMLTENGAEHASETWVTTHRGFFFKVRVSFFTPRNEALDASVRTLLDRLGQATHE
jgi:hypothetical protein